MSLNWGILGCGCIANDFVTALKAANKDHKVVAAAASSLTRSSEFLEKLDLSDAKAYGTYADLVADPNVEVIYIALLNNSHFPWALKAVEAGKHVLCEKPLAVNAKQVRELVAKAKENKVFLMEEIKAIIKKGELGSLRSASITFGVDLGGRHQDPSKGDTPIMDIGVYVLAMSLFAFDDEKPECVDVSGFKDEKGVDRWGNITLKFGGNKHAMLYYNGTAQYANQATLTFDQGHVQIPSYFWCPTEYTVVKGKYTPSKVDKTTFAHPLSGDAAKYNFDNSEGLKFEADHVYEQIKAGRTESPIMSLSSSLTLAETLEAARKGLGVHFPQDD